MGYWPKHPRKDLEMLLVAFDMASWQIERGKTYYSVKCPCGDHKRMIHLTPSGANYGKNVQQWLKRQNCAPKDEGEATS
ncbi:hypothetical protein [Jatrophihabitans sp.]|uniref:hypothetical protein n=1 Tax=Jatrophihabitans sp. TaxID=1932789 RepID=UPI0030C74340|nr:hypothetical protein [Jatrophihabitans sp.]